MFTLAANMLLPRFWACEGLERQTSRSAFLVNFAAIGGLLLAAIVQAASGNHSFGNRLTAAKRIRTVRAIDLERLP